MSHLEISMEDEIVLAGGCKDTMFQVTTQFYEIVRQRFHELPGCKRVSNACWYRGEVDLSN